MKYLFSILILFFTTICIAQKKEEKLLLNEAINNYELLNLHPEEAYEEAKNIEIRSKRAKAREAELKAIQTQCEYFKIQTDFIKMMESAKRLSSRSSQFKKPFYQVIAKRYLFESYLFTGLPESAFIELEKGRDIVNKLDRQDSVQTIERINFYIAYSNYYLLNEDYENQLKYIRLAGNELKSLSESAYKDRLLSIQYSNLASSFFRNKEMDSAWHFASVSQSLNNKNPHREVRFNNLMILGTVSLDKGSFDSALNFFNEAEEISGYKNHFDTEILFESIAEAHKQLGNQNLARIYKRKQDSIKLIVSQSQNKSLHNLLKEKKEKKTSMFLYFFLSVILVILMVIIFFVVRKNKLLAEQEKKNTQFLEEFAKNPSGEDFSRLLDLLKSNDPAFMFYFEKTFPDFSEKLLNVNPELSNLDIEFCALLKLKIATKEIAQYTFRAPQTIRNKKYIIKKKLKIPKDIDIYQWFDSL